MARVTHLDQGSTGVSRPFLHPDQDQGREKMPYSVETPYGFLLDLDFLKYVDDIEKGQTLRKLPLHRKVKGSKQARDQIGGWASTESLSSTASEDGKPTFSPRPRTASYGTHDLPGNDGSLPASPAPAAQLLPLASPNSVGRGSRVESTLLETSRRLEEAQLSLLTGGRPAVPERTDGPSKNSTCPPPPNSLSGEGQAEPVKTSPPNSGRSTPVPAVSPAHLHHVREQMAAALKQLKELEEQVKTIPLLEQQICQLKQEKEQLVAGLGEKGEAETDKLGVIRFPPRQALQDGAACLDTGGPQEGETTKGRTSKIAELKKLTERLTGPERAGKSRGGGRPSKAEQPSGQRSIGVGEEVDMSEVICYYRSQRPCREVAVGCETETNNAEVWVMESFLGVSSAAEEEMQLVQQRVQHQQTVIAMLEGHLKEATEELEELRVEVCARRPGSLVSQATLACPETAEACVEAVMPTRCQAVGSHVDVVEVGVQSFLQVSHVGVGCNLQREEANVEANPAKDSSWKTSPILSGTKHEGWKWHLEPTAGTPDHGMTGEGSHSEDTRQPTGGKEGTLAQLALQTTKDEPEAGPTLPLGMGGKGSHAPNGAEGASGTGALKSIMKRLDSPAKTEPGGSGKKTLQFVGLLNGEYESTSSEEEEEEEELEEEEEEEEGSPGVVSLHSSFSETLGDLEGDVAASPDVSDSSEDEEGSPGTEAAPGHPRLGPDPEDAARQGGATPKVKERFELSPWMREACLVVRSHLGPGGRGAPKSKELLSSSSLVLREWFRVSSQKSSRASKVAKYLQALDELSPALLAHVLNLSDGNGNMALHYSVSHSNFDIVRLLLDTGVCNVNHQNKAGYTALMLAALATMERQDDMAVVRRLFDLGNVNAKASQAGQTALMLAVSHGRQEMVEALLACGADVNLQDEEGSTALMCACEHGRAETVQLLLAQPACDASVADQDGNDAVAIALEAGHDHLAALISAHLTQSADRTGP